MELKFIYSEKATKFCEIFPVLLTTVHTVKSKGKILQNLVSFSEYMNFKLTNVLQFNLGLRSFCLNILISAGTCFCTFTCKCIHVYSNYSHPHVCTLVGRLIEGAISEFWDFEPTLVFCYQGRNRLRNRIKAARAISAFALAGIEL